MTTAIAFPDQMQNTKEVTPQVLAEAALKLSKASTHLLLNSSSDAAFWACLAMNTPKVWDKNIGTAGMGIKTMYLNPLFVNSLTVLEVVFLLAHELGHKMLMHMARRGHRDPRGWNVAGDYVINDMLTEGKIGEPIKGGCFQAGSRLKTTEEVYDSLPTPPPGGGGGKGYGQGQGGYGIGDDLVEEQMSDAEQIAAEQDIQVQVSQAARAAQQRGKLSAGLSRIIEEIINSETPWYDKLRHMMQFFVKGDYSWKRPNRRFVGQGVYLPSLDKQPKMGTTVIAMDTSGSINGPVLSQFFGELNKIMEDVLPETTHLIYCDAEAFYGAAFTADELPITPASQDVKGGGGTSFKPVFEMVEEMGLEPEVLIYLTDGYGDWQTCKDPGYPVIWVSIGTTEGAAFGDVIALKGGGCE